MIRFPLGATLLVCAGLLAGCDQEGPAEQAGEALDNSAEEAGDALEDLGDKAEDSTQ